MRKKIPGRRSPGPSPLRATTSIKLPSGSKLQLVHPPVINVDPAMLVNAEDFRGNEVVAWLGIQTDLQSHLAVPLRKDLVRATPVVRLHRATAHQRDEHHEQAVMRG